MEYLLWIQFQLCALFFRHSSNFLINETRSDGKLSKSLAYTNGNYSRGDLLRGTRSCIYHNNKNTRSLFYLRIII